MNAFIETLNNWGQHALRFAWPMLWQSSLMIVLLFALDYALRRKVRAAVRYALWCLVLVKLLLPPSLALPTSVAWWLRQSAPAPAAATNQQKQPATFVVTYPDADTPARVPPRTIAANVRPAPSSIPISGAATALGVWSLISFGLLLWLGVRWRHVTKLHRSSVPALSHGERSGLNELFESAKGLAGVRQPVPCRLIERPMSPAVCGLFRPVILLPRLLADQLPAEQLRTILLHELIHLRRRDVWVNCLQALLQIFYWWHPLLWLANARIRSLREEAVDDAVMHALADQADVYAPTLLEVAKLAFYRPLTALGLVGILESRRGLRQRIERLMNFKTPRRAGLSVASLLGMAAFTVLAMPMGEAPSKRVAVETRSDQSPVVGVSTSTEAPVNRPAQVAANSRDAEPRTAAAPVASNAVTDIAPISIITADSIEVDVAKQTMKAKGNVQIQSEAVTLRADELFASASGELRTAESKPVAIESPTIAGSDRLQLAAVSSPSATADSGRSSTNLSTGKSNVDPNISPQILIKAKFIEIPDSFTNLVAKLSWPNSTGTGVWTTVLAPTRTREFLAGLQSQTGAALLSEGQVTTLSGRQAQIQIADMKLFAMWETNGGSKSQTLSVGPTLDMKKVPLGPILDIVPYAEADGHTIQLTVSPTLVEFLGYDYPGPFIVQSTNSATAVPITLPPVPHFRVRQVSLSTNVWDGHTLVIYGMPATDLVRLKDKVPVLGDLPLVGPLFRSERNVSRTTRLIVLVTPMLVDAAGNRVHPEGR